MLQIFTMQSNQNKVIDPFCIENFSLRKSDISKTHIFNSEIRAWNITIQEFFFKEKNGFCQMEDKNWTKTDFVWSGTEREKEAFSLLNISKKKLKQTTQSLGSLRHYVHPSHKPIPMEEEG